MIVLNGEKFGRERERERERERGQRERKWGTCLITINLGYQLLKK